MQLVDMSTLLIILSLGPGYHHPMGPECHTLISSALGFSKLSNNKYSYATIKGTMMYLG
jgi:hypothetical protein